MRDWIGDRLLLILTLLAALAAVALMALIAWRVFRGASLSIGKFGLGFICGHDLGREPRHLRRRHAALTAPRSPR